VAPSHQYPAGVSLSIPRRLALLAWAERQRAWILEDDYDSEFRFDGAPLTAMQGLDQAGRVVYVGTFNKTVFPALRIGFVIVPPMLVDSFLAVRRVGAQHAPTVDQMILTDFLVDGHYARHMRRMRTLCRERRDLLLAAARLEAPGLLEIGQTEGGLHAIGWLCDGLDDAQVSAAAARAGVQAAPISGQYLGSCPRPGLILGYAGYGRHQINTAMRRLAEALRTAQAPEPL
jgi:GntR family transcriptional regulator/MocR family aminotransferase